MSENQTQLLIDILRRSRGAGEVARTIGQNALAEIPAGLTGLGSMMIGEDNDKSAARVNDVRDSLSYEPQSPEGQEMLGSIGSGINWAGEKLGQLPGAAQAQEGWESFTRAAPGAAAITAGVAGIGVPEGRGGAVAARAASKEAARVAAAKAQAKALRTRKTYDKKMVNAATAGEEDIGRSFGADVRMKGGGAVPREEVESALANRATYRQEPSTLPKPADQMSEQDWIDFGNQYGADFSQAPMQSLGVSDIASRRELVVPGGLEGEFTIPDLFRIKADNFDPTVLGQETHNKLMQKLLRTHTKGRVGDDVDIFNDLNFALLSPNAPLTQNEFLAQRLRAQSPEDLAKLAAREDNPNLGRDIDVESGVGAAARGGLGVKGTADLGNQATLARLLREKPEMFRPGEGETIRDVGFRIMNQVPGLGVKTASLGVPWTDLARANTSAVDLHMIRNNYKRLMAEDPEFAARVQSLTGKERKEKKTGRMVPMTEEEAAINLIGGAHPESVYRSKKTGELSEKVPSYLTPEKLAHEPQKFVTPNDWYTRIMGYVDESRGTNPEIELFPEQWRLWDTYRGRVEPHEMAHPDWRKLPKQSFSELQDALRSHRELGYMDAPDKVTMKNEPVRTGGDWRKLYYGHADPALLAATAAGGAGALAATTAALRNRKKEENDNER